MFKYADDTNLLVPESSDVDIADEFKAIEGWAIQNGLIINVDKTKELVFHIPNPRRSYLPPPINGIERVKTAKLLGVIFQGNFCFNAHADALLKVCSQRVYLLKQLRDQGLPIEHLHTVFQAIILNRLTYAIPAWGPFTTAEIKNRLNGFLKRCHRYGVSKQVFDIDMVLCQIMQDLFLKMQSPIHCLNQLLPCKRIENRSLRDRGHNYQLPHCNYKLYKQSFVNHCLFSFVQ
jgi:hypothetical protein